MCGYIYVISYIMYTNTVYYEGIAVRNGFAGRNVHICFPTPCNHDLYSDYLVEGVCFCAPLKLKNIRIMYII